MAAAAYRFLVIVSQNFMQAQRSIVTAWGIVEV